jgi:hypothetical protein
MTRLAHSNSGRKGTFAPLGCVPIAGPLAHKFPHAFENEEKK